MDLNTIASKNYEVRGQKVMLDADLSELYGIATLKSHFVTSSWGGKINPTSVFTEHGVIMLASVLRSESAIKMNIAIVRAFIGISM